MKKEIAEGKITIPITNQKVTATKTNNPNTSIEELPRIELEVTRY